MIGGFEAHQSTKRLQSGSLGQAGQTPQPRLAVLQGPVVVVAQNLLNFGQIILADPSHANCAHQVFCLLADLHILMQLCLLQRIEGLHPQLGKFGSGLLPQRVFARPQLFDQGVHPSVLIR